MFRIFTKFQNNVRIAITLNQLAANRARVCATNLPGSKLAALDQSNDLSDGEPMRRAALHDEESVQRVKHLPADLEPRTSSSLADLFKCCESIASLLSWLDENMFKIKGDQLPEVYAAIGQLVRDLRRTRLIDGSLAGSIQVIHSSSTFRLFLDHTNRFLDDFDTVDLVALFGTFQQIQLNPTTRIVRNVIHLLNSRLQELPANQIDMKLVSKCLMSCYHYRCRPLNQSKENEHLREFNEMLLAIAKSKIQNGELYDDDQNVLDLLRIFLMPHFDPTFEVASQIATLFLSSKMELDFKMSVRLLNKITQSYNFTAADMSNLPRSNELRRRFDKGELYPAVLSKLVDHCNATICKALNSKSSLPAEDFVYLLIKIHGQTSSISSQFKNFYDPNLLEPLSRHLMQFFDTNDRYKYLAFQVAENYSSAGVYNEKFLRFVYDLYCNATDRFRSNLNSITTYNLFSRLRLPFVNHQRVTTELLFNFSNQFYRLTRNKSLNSAKILCRLILNEVYDERLYAHLNSMIKGGSLTDISTFHYKQTALARNHLLTFGELTPLKLESSDILNSLMSTCPVINRQIIAPNRLSKVQHKIRPSAYLSNGIYLDCFAIYDSQTEDLVPLSQYMDLFYRIESIPLKKGQQM